MKAWRHLLLSFLVLSLPTQALSAPGAGRRVQKRDVVPKGSWNARLLDSGSYRGALRRARQVMRTEKGMIRLKRDLVTIVIPDLHGRRDYLERVLKTKDRATGKTYGTLLAEKQVQMVCLGDVMHTEVRGAQWRRGMSEKVMRAEMAESLGTLKRIAELKIANPENFHMIRGNHDDVGSRGGKLVRQVDKTRGYLCTTLGNSLVKDLGRFFDALPVAAVGSNFFMAHANPMFPVTKKDIDQRADAAAVSLTRTRLPTFNNLRRLHAGKSGDAAVSKLLTAVGADPKQAYYIHGHLWADPMAVEGQRVYFGHPRQQTFLRLDPNSKAPPWRQLIDAKTGDTVHVEVNK